MYSFQKFLKVFDFTVFSKLWFWESRKLINPFQPSVAFWIETSCLICSASQMTGFYIKFNDELKRVNWMMSVIRKTNYYFVHRNPYAPNAPFLYPLKTSENLKIFCCFQGVEKRCIRNNWVNWKIHSSSHLYSRQLVLV